jgi:hypothetical protein
MRLIAGFCILYSRPDSGAILPSINVAAKILFSLGVPFFAGIPGLYDYSYAENPCQIHFATTSCAEKY